ncbi:hypothetical protein GQ457_04G018470 [Hibiscus cannabinus]
MSNAWTLGVDTSNNLYNSVNTPMRMMLDASVNDTLLDKSSREGLEILEKFTHNDYQHPSPRRVSDGKMPRQFPHLSSSDKLPPSEPSTTIDISRYRRLLGLLLYLTITRPYISFVVNRLAHYMHGPSLAHWTTAKRILPYLKGTLCHVILLLSTSSLHLIAFIDVDWDGSSTDGKSTTGYAICLGSNLIYWKSARQKSVSCSSTEAEYCAMRNTTAELLWVQHLLQEIVVALPKPPSLFCDNSVPHMFARIRFFTLV